MPIEALHHVQLAMPPGGEARARRFYMDGLGLSEVAKPLHLAGRGGCWFELSEVRVHLGVETDFGPARKAHPAFLVTDVRALAATLARAGYRVTDDEPLEAFDRVYVEDPFGNRIELMQALRARAVPMTFVLDPRLEADTFALGDLALSCVRLMNDARYPWLILVPRRPGLVEILDLPSADRGALMEELALCSSALKRIVAPDKLNIGAIGNRVPQLHVHIVARFIADPAWPDPVWGRGSPIPYTAEAASERSAAIWSAVTLV